MEAEDLLRNHTLSSDKEVAEFVRTPAVTDWLKGVALRDLSVHERHAACIDANGDVYQWGDGFFGPSSTASTSGKPVLTLRSKVRSHGRMRSVNLTRGKYRTLSSSKLHRTEYLLCLRLDTSIHCLQRKRSKNSLPASLRRLARHGGELAGYGVKRKTLTSYKSHRMISWLGARGIA